MSTDPLAIPQEPMPEIKDRSFSDQGWYAVVDDCIGGWAISNVDKPTSEQYYRKGELELGSFLTEEMARYIVGLHNYLHRTRFPDQWKDHND